jgi:plastocyanin
MPRKSAIFFAIGAWLLPMLVHAQASIEGTVALLPARTIPAGEARYPGAPGSPARVEQPLAVVWLEGQFPAPTTPPENARMVQKDAQFIPSILPVRVGTKVEFPNDDDFYHNVFSYSKIKSFDLGRYKKGEEPPAIQFDKPGVVRLNCEIHEQMRAAIVVLDTPYFKTTTTNGSDRLDGLPAGKYALKTWLDEKHIREQQVELHDGDKLHVDFPAQ